MENLPLVVVLMMIWIIVLLTLVCILLTKIHDRLEGGK